MVRWRRVDGLHCAIIPVLAIAVSANDETQLDKRLQHEIRSALNREKLTSNLQALIRLDERRDLQIQRRTVTLRLPTLKQHAQDIGEISSITDRKQKPILPDIAHSLNIRSLEPAYENTETVLRLLEKLQAQKPRSILLVGKSGVGKTAAFSELVRLRSSLGLPFTQFWETSGARIVAGMSGFGMWEERCMRMAQEASQTRSVLHLGNLAELAGVGQSTASETSIAEFLRSYLERGDFVAVCECTSEQYTLLERDQPHVIGAFDKLEVPEPEWTVVRKILQQSADFEFNRRRAQLSVEALEEIVRLHRRYGGYSANPGRPLRFLKNLLRDSSRTSGVIVDSNRVLEAFTRETGLPRAILDDQVAMIPADVQRWFEQRVIGQAGAVQSIVETLSRVKARLTRPGRPIASLLFVGPTGVGKTEMAKALAEFLFSDRGRMTRFDMSEYSDPIAVRRLIGGLNGSEGLLTSRVREQPFSVLLLDECEKADASAFDLFLQILGEARLTDAAGRVADFTNTVIILTSNLGAQGFLRGSIGFTESEREDAEHHFTEEARKYFRPELFNRIDDIIPFSTLDEDAVARIARKEFDSICRRDGFFNRSLSLDLSETVTAELIRRVKNSPYGARPLKREIEREILAPLAAALPAAPSTHTVARIEVEENRFAVQLAAGPERQARPAATTLERTQLYELVNLRRHAQGLHRSMKPVQDEIDQLEIARRKATTAKGAWISPELRERLAELPRLTRLVRSIEEQLAILLELERDLIPEMLDPELKLTTGRLKSLQDKLLELADALIVFRIADPNRILLAVSGSSRIWWTEFAELYLKAFARLQVNKYLLQEKPDPDKPGESIWQQLPLEQVSQFPQIGEEKYKRGILLDFQAPMIALRLAGERGWHTIREGSNTKSVFIDASFRTPETYRPPSETETAEITSQAPKVRRFDKSKRVVDDHMAGKLSWADESPVAMLLKALQKTLEIRREKVFHPGT